MHLKLTAAQAKLLGLPENSVTSTINELQGLFDKIITHIPSSTDSLVAMATHRTQLQRGYNGFGALAGNIVVRPASKGNYIYMDRDIAALYGDCEFKVVYEKKAMRYYPYIRMKGSSGRKRWVSFGRYLLGISDKKGNCCRYLNGDPRDCTAQNIRCYTRAQVAYSRNKGRTGDPRTGYRGISISRSGKFRASITCKRRKYNLGLFTAEVDAVAARDKAAAKHYKRAAKFEMFNSSKMTSAVRLNHPKVYTKALATTAFR